MILEAAADGAWLLDQPLTRPSGTLSRRERDLGEEWTRRYRASSSRAFSRREKVPEGRMRCAIGRRGLSGAPAALPARDDTITTPAVARWSSTYRLLATCRSSPSSPCPLLARPA